MVERREVPEQRADARLSAEHPIHLVVSLHGFDAEDRFEAKGITVNLSRSGALVRVNRAISPGSRCLVHLPDAVNRIGRTLIYGKVLRSHEIEGTFEVAIRFDTRLSAISLEDTLDSL